MFLVANLHILNVFSEGKRQNVMYSLPFVGYKHRFYVQYALYFCFYGIALQWHKKRGCVKTKNSEKLPFILTVSLPHKY